MILASIALAGAASFLLLSPLTRLTLALIRRVNYRAVSLVALLVILAIVTGLTRWSGLATGSPGSPQAQAADGARIAVTVPASSRAVAA